jgi:hypothetical protein
LKNFTSTGINIASTGNESWAISGNTIFEETPRTTGLIGITFASLGTNTITQNTIRDLNTSSSVIGIRLNDVRGTTVSRNRIYSIPSTSGSTSDLTGVQLFGAGTATMNVVNNMISIVPAFTNAQIIRGIDDFGFTGDAFNVYYNSVYIAARRAGRSIRSHSIAVTGCDNVEDNIFFNGRVAGRVATLLRATKKTWELSAATTTSWLGRVQQLTRPFMRVELCNNADDLRSMAGDHRNTRLNSQGSVAGVGNYTSGTCLYRRTICT